LEAVKATTDLGVPPHQGGREFGETEGEIAQQLRLLADRLLEEAKAGPPNHDTAITLLAADALITCSCELVAEIRPQELAEL